MPRTNSLNQAKQVLIVDPKADDYNCLADLVESGSIRWTITSSGASSLRLVPSHRDALWLLNTELPDMTGFDLLEMMRSMAPELTIFIVDDTYHPERETQALQLSAARYLCKPVHRDWITGWRGLVNPAATKNQSTAKPFYEGQKTGPTRSIHQ